MSLKMFCQFCFFFFFLNAVMASKINTPFLFASIYIGNAVVSFEIFVITVFFKF